MNQAFKKKWLKALRTPPDEGGHLQCRHKMTKRGRYRNQPVDKFCCLGVAKNLMILDGMTADNWSNHDNLTNEEREQLGLTREDTQQLVAWNDVHGWNFLRIADWIEENL